MDQVDAIMQEVNQRINQGIVRAADFLVGQLKSAIPVSHFHRRHPEQWRGVGHTRDRIYWQPNEGKPAGRRRTRRQRPKSQNPLTGAYESAAAGTVRANVIKGVTVVVEWPWLPNEVGYMAGYRMAKYQVGKRKREKVGSRYVDANPIVRKTVDACADQIEAMIAGDA